MKDENYKKYSVKTIKNKRIYISLFKVKKKDYIYYFLTLYIKLQFILYNSL